MPAETFLLPPRLCVLALWAVVVSVLTAPAASQTLRSNQSNKRGAGSAAVLLGRVCLVEVFVSDRQSSWPAREMAAVRKAMQEAVGFIAREADRYEADVTLMLAPPKEVKLDLSIPTAFGADLGWTQRALRAIDGKQSGALAADVKARHKADHVLFILHVNKSATSYNLAWSPGKHPDYAAERVVCFRRYADGRPTAAATYAHEILHGFGAGELYFPFDEDNDRREVAEELFPDDVMFRVDYDIDALMIGEYTAFRVGWLDRLDPRHELFEDPP